ncbi:hypothetical protein [Kitasatospora sp. McL0602]|uniref:hypothetical protein n=1 Tax=Kitasatospora sp. McL0602 TaxID=3439530 RepID=UPI003F8CDD11
MHAHIHPLASHAPNAILGYRADGRPIRSIAGGNGEGEGTGANGGDSGQQGAGQTGGTGQQQASQDTGQPGAQGGAQGGNGQGDGAKDGTADHAATVARLEKDLAAARKEAASTRVSAKASAAAEARTELAQQIGKALGLVQDDTPPDPAKLAEQITSQTARISELEAAARARDTELAVHSLAEKHGAKVGALLDSRAFVKAIGELDPAAKDFTAQLDAAIKQAVTDNPTAYRVAPPAGRSGPDLTGGTGERGKARPTSLGAAISAAYQQ